MIYSLKFHSNSFLYFLPIWHGVWQPGNQMLCQILFLAKVPHNRHIHIGQRTIVGFSFRPPQLRYHSSTALPVCGVIVLIVLT